MTTYLEIEVGVEDFSGPLRQILASAKAVDQIQLKQSWVEVVANQPSLSKLLLNSEDQPLLKLSYLLTDHNLPIAVETLWLPTEGILLRNQSGAIEIAGESSNAKAQPLLQVENLVKHFPITKGMLVSKQVGAVEVDGISFAISPGETLALVGESGCENQPPVN